MVEVAGIEIAPYLWLDKSFGEVVVGLFKVLCHAVRKEEKITFFERRHNAFADYAW